MQLIIDIGNTRVKAALFDEKTMHTDAVFDSIEAFLTSDFVSYSTISMVIAATVAENTDKIQAHFKDKNQFLLFRSDTPLPIANSYQSKTTLGSDRIAACVGANLLYPNNNILVIDAGTCIKYNFINQKNEFIGGAISPGLTMRFKALHDYTARLPLINADENFSKFVGTNTVESILSGVQYAIAKEMDGFIDEYINNYNNLKVLLTGGDAKIFEKRLKNSIFADPFLILKGLNEILLYNRK